MGDQVHQIQRARPGPFPAGITDDNITKAALLETITDAGGLWDNKTWCPIAWSPDCMYFAYTHGRSGSVVELVPWNQYKHCLMSKDPYTREGQQMPLRHHRFDAGETVCSLAIGCSLPESQAQLNWYRYKHVKGLNVAAGTRSGQIKVWNIDTGDGTKPLILLDHSKLISDLKFAPDGSLRLLSASWDGSLKIWHLQDDGNMYPTFHGKEFDGNRYRHMHCVAWSPNSKIVCGVGTSRGVFLWDVVNREGKKLFASDEEIQGHLHDVMSCDFSPDGALLVTCSRDTKAIIWDPHTGEALRRFLHLYPAPTLAFAGGANDSYVRSVSFSKDGRHVASLCDDGYVRFWEIFSAEVPRVIAPVKDGLCCSLSPHGTTLIVGTSADGISIWEAPMRVSSLRHYCRLTIRRIIDRSNISQLGIHTQLEYYLEYVDFDSEAIPPLKLRMKKLLAGRQNGETILNGYT